MSIENKAKLVENKAKLCVHPIINHVPAGSTIETANTHTCLGSICHGHRRITCRATTLTHVPYPTIPEVISLLHFTRRDHPRQVFQWLFSNKLYIHSSENLIHVCCFMWVLENNFQSINVTYQLNLYIGSFCWFFWARHFNFWCLANNLYELFDSPRHLPFVVLFDHSSSIHRPLWPLVVQSSSPLPLVVDSSRHLQLPLVFWGWVPQKVTEN